MGGVKVEQFAVGFGQALFSWRKGIGFRVGNTQKELREATSQEHLEPPKRSRSATSCPSRRRPTARP